MATDVVTLPIKRWAKPCFTRWEILILFTNDTTIAGPIHVQLEQKHVVGWTITIVFS
jgi:hypothetical protein